MRTFNFKFWIILLILLAGISWSVLPKYNPSFDFIAMKDESKKEIMGSESSSRPVGQGHISEENDESLNSDVSSVAQDTAQNTISNNNDQQKLINTNPNSEKLISGKDPDQTRNSILANERKKQSSTSPTARAAAQGKSIVGGASTPKELKVSETGEGGTLLLREALRQLLPGGSILLQKGYYKVHLGEMRIPDSTIRGERRESVLEFNDTFKVGSSNLKFQNLKIIHYGTSEAFLVSAGKKLTLEKVFLQNNANDGVSVVNAHFVANDLELKGSQHAVIIRDATSLEIQNIRLSDVDYGISFEGSKSYTIKELTIKNNNVSPIHFASEGSGQLTCVKCSFDKKPSHNAPRLILKN